MNKTKAMRALLYSGDLLAVDLGTFSVKVLSLKAKERSLTVLGSAQREVWRELAETKTEEEKTEAYAGALRRLMAEHGFKPRNASISLAGSTIILRFLALPAGYKHDSEAALPAEARALIPFDEAEAVVQTHLLDGAKGDKQAPAEMMLAVAQKKAVQSAMDVVRMAGLRPAVIVNDILALANAYEFFDGKKAGETVVLVNAGASSTSVSVLENGTTKAARILNIAGNTFTRSLKRDFGIDLEEAERLKIEHGLAVPVGKTTEEDLIAARVARALMPTVKDLGVEIHRTIDSFLERRPAGYPPIGKIVLAGGSAALKGLPESLAAETGMDVKIFSPMVNVTGKDGRPGIAALSPGLAGPCGLALSNTLVRRTYKPRINLVPRRVRRAAIIQDVSPGFWKLIAGPVLVVFGLCAYAIWAVRVSHKEAAEEHGLAEAAKKTQNLQGMFKKKKKQAVVAKREENPFAFLARLTISGVFGDSRNALVMLNGNGSVYVARGGKLYDANEEEVRGVTSAIRDASLALTAGGRLYLIDLPK